jgi:guanylate kinase
VGKGSIVERLVATDDRLVLSRSWTTRTRRPHEAADAYVFVDRPTFEARRDAGGFLEWNEHFGNLYGTPLPESTGDGDLLLEIEVNGARQVRARHPDAVVICILAPSRAEQEERLRGRGEPDEQLAVRLARADMEESIGRRIADEVVVNDDLDRAVGEVAGILEAHRSPHPGDH